MNYDITVGPFFNIWRVRAKGAVFVAECADMRTLVRYFKQKTSATITTNYEPLVTALSRAGITAIYR